MKNRKIANMAKKIVAVTMTITMLAVGIVVMPETTDAADVYEDKIIYEDRTSEFKKMWKTGGAGTTPQKAGYVFGGWYENTGGTDSEGNTVYKALSDTEDSAQAKIADESLTEGICAKFVPAYVLSVKAQLDSNTKKADDGNKAYIRVLSSVDSADYLKVGFDIWLNHSIDAKQFNDGNALEHTTVYDGLKVDTTDDEGNVKESKVLAASQIFGVCSKYVSVWRLEDIIDANDAFRIYVRPYWVTCDGTIVEGLAKYIHVEDGYSDYISVPINIYQAGDIAGGYLQMKYNTEYFEVHDVEYAKLFGEMQHNANLDGAVKFAGNIVENEAGTYENVEGNDLYANVRFTLTETGKEKYSGVGSGTFFDFEIENESFSNINEDLVSVDAWDAKY